VQWANGVLCKIGTGAFHAGVEVYGREYSFGHRSDGSSGVVWCPPRGAEGHAFREAVDLGAVRLSKSQVQRLVGRMADEWPGRDYDLFRRNCCHFCEELCQRLGVARVPEYVFSLAAAGARIRDGVGVAVSSVGTAASTARSSMETLTSWDPDQKGRAIWTGAIQAAARLVAPPLPHPPSGAQGFGGPAATRSAPADLWSRLACSLGSAGEAVPPAPAASSSPRQWVYKTPPRHRAGTPASILGSPTPVRNLAKEWSALSQSSRITSL